MDKALVDWFRNKGFLKRADRYHTYTFTNKQFRFFRERALDFSGGGRAHLISHGGPTIIIGDTVKGIDIVWNQLARRSHCVTSEQVATK